MHREPVERNPHLHFLDGEGALGLSREEDILSESSLPSSWRFLLSEEGFAEETAAGPQVWSPACQKIAGRRGGVGWTQGCLSKSYLGAGTDLLPEAAGSVQ